MIIMDKLSKHFNEFIFPKIISPAINIALENADKNYSKFVNLTSLMDENTYKVKLSNLYEEKREWLKKIYFPKAKLFNQEDESTSNGGDKFKRLDMHKIAAVITRCILGLKPFAFFVDKANEYINENNKLSNFNWLSQNYLINYKLAVDVAMLINLYDAIDKANRIDDNILSGDKVQLISDFANKGFDFYEFPILNLEHESFYNSLIINLAINDANGRDFDYLGFATNCFQLQQYGALKYSLSK